MKTLVSFIPLLLASALVLGCDGGDTDTDSEGEFDVPSDADALQAFLDAEDYADFASESAVHGQTNGSPHANVRIYLNDTLDSSLAAGNSTHPAGSAAIKELYDTDGLTRIGWAVSVKTQADSAGGGGWYWYEQINGSVSADETGASQCTGCHIGSGIDFIRVDYPLQ